METADIPEAVAEAAAPAVKEGPPGPLPFNYVANQDEGDGESWTLLGYSHTAVAKDWRKPTEKIKTVFKRPTPDNLFSAGELVSMAKQPDALLNPPPLTKEEKKAKKEANKGFCMSLHSLTSTSRV